MESFGWCHFNFWSPNNSKMRDPYLPCLPLLSSPHLHLGVRGCGAKGRSEEKGRWELVVRASRNQGVRRHLLLWVARPPL